MRQQEASAFSRPGEVVFRPDGSARGKRRLFHGVVAPRTNAWATPDATAVGGFKADAPKAHADTRETPYGLFPPVPGAGAFRTPLETPRAKSPTSSLAILPPLPDCFYTASPRSVR